MANVRYSFANERFLTGQLDWTAGTFKIVLIDATKYSVQPDVDQTLADIPVAARIAISGLLAGMTATKGVAKANDVTMATVQGQEVQALVIFHDTGNEGTSELVAYLDTANGLPYIPQGTTAVIHWDTGPNGIFRL